jgi:hypothetical protein
MPAEPIPPNVPTTHRYRARTPLGASLAAAAFVAWTGGAFLCACSGPVQLERPVRAPAPPTVAARPPTASPAAARPARTPAYPCACDTPAFFVCEDAAANAPCPQIAFQRNEGASRLLDAAAQDARELMNHPPPTGCPSAHCALARAGVASSQSAETSVHRADALVWILFTYCNLSCRGPLRDAVWTELLAVERRLRASSSPPAGWTPSTRQFTLEWVDRLRELCAR